MNLSTLATAGDWLRERRKALDLTQEALAERVGCSAQSVRKIEAGKQRPSQQLAVLLVAHLEVPAAERDEIVRRLRAAIPSTEPPDNTPIATPSGDSTPATRLPPLPVPLTPLIGRAAEVRRVRELLLTVGARLVTLVGSPGIGKTRLALAAAQTLRDEFADGLCFVELAPLSDPELVPTTIAAALGLPQSSDASHERLASYLGNKQLLLVLDNFEHLLAAAAPFDLLLKEAPGLKVLATSRTPLRIYGEKQFPVPALNVPDPQASMAPEQWLHYDAVRLFVERVRDVEPDFELTAQDAATVAEICARLDGLPLAIELAAARVRVLPPRALLAQLGDRLKLLQGGAVTLPPRQQTLFNAIAWSYELLNPAEQQLFRRLGVFQGETTLAAIGAVCGDQPAPASSLAMLDLVDSLIGKSLLRRRDGQQTPRFWMLETIKEYARAQLARSGEEEQVRLRHAEFYLKPAAGSKWEQSGEERLAWMAELDPEQDNIRAALTWALEGSSAERLHGLALAWRVGGGLGRYWWCSNQRFEGRRWMAALLEQEALLAAQPDLTPAMLKRGKAALLQMLGLNLRWHDPQARPIWEQSLRLFQELGDRLYYAVLSGLLADLLFSLRDLAAAQPLAEEYLAVSRDLGYGFGIAEALRILSALAYISGDEEKGRTLTHEALRATQLAAGWANQAYLVFTIASGLCEIRQFAAAEPIWEEYRRTSHDHGDTEGVAHALCGLGLAAYGQGRFAAARQLYLRGFATPADNPPPAYLIIQLAGVEAELALLPALRQGATARTDEALLAAATRVAVLLSAGAGLMRDELDNIEKSIYELVAATTRDILGAAAFGAARVKGRAMSRDETYAYAATPVELPAAQDAAGESVPPAYLVAAAP